MSGGGTCLPRATRGLPEEPTLLHSMAYRTQPFAVRVRCLIGDSGLASEETVMLIPQWLAAMMGWQ